MEAVKKESVFDLLMNRIDQIVNAVCVAALIVQVVAVIVMVVGRYVFNFVPRGTEQLALFCMVWFSLLSISLSVRDDAHIKMEIMDALVSPEKLVYFQIFAALVNLIFSACMFGYGLSLVQLTKGTTMSGIQISEGWLYLSIPAAGLFMLLASLAVVIREIGRKVRKNVR